MGTIYDLVKDLPLEPVMRERIALAEDRLARALEEKERAEKENEELPQRVTKLEGEIADLRARIPAEPEGDLGDDTQKVLIYLFRGEGDALDVGIMAGRLQMERGLAQYHLDLLEGRGLAIMTGGNYLSSHEYWSLTDEGRRHVVEKGMLS